MLSRTADHLYWLARYSERAENLARLLNITQRMSLIVEENQDSNWLAGLTCSGQHELYSEKFSTPTAASALYFMTFDATNPSSLYMCIKAARENAHAVRGTITSELWETLNASWLEMKAVDPTVLKGDSEKFFDWVKERAHLARGVMLGTMLADEALCFLSLGTFLERADATARILDVKYHILLPAAGDVGGAVDYYQWGALLRSVSGFEVYRKIYSNTITPWRVAELLILRKDMPRSLHRCLDQVYNQICKVRNSSSGETERRIGELYSRLAYGDMKEIFQAGLHEFLTNFVNRLADIDERITEDFLVPKYSR